NMYAVGTFSSIKRGSTTYTRNNIFSFSITSPYNVTTWAPNVVGPYGTTQNGSDVVDTIAFVNGDCTHAYIGGKFSSINGTAVKKIAEITTTGTTGSGVTGVRSNASGTIQTIVAANRHPLVGGDFTRINGDPPDPSQVRLK